MIHDFLHYLLIGFAFGVGFGVAQWILNRILK